MLLHLALYLRKPRQMASSSSTVCIVLCETCHSHGVAFLLVEILLHLNPVMAYFCLNKPLSN